MQSSHHLESEDEFEQNEQKHAERTVARELGRSAIVRNLIGFWLLGLTNNFGYVIMLSAAHDLLTPPSDNGTHNATNRTGRLIPECNPIGTGLILMADILPALFVKISAPFYILLIPYWIKVGLTVILGATSFLLVSFGASTVIWLSVMGVICASIGSGFGEVVLLGLSSHFDKNVVSTYSSGTGAAGLFGALSYAGLTAIGVTPSNSLLIMLIIPFIMTLTYFFLLVKPLTIYRRHNVSDHEQGPVASRRASFGTCGDEHSTVRARIVPNRSTMDEDRVSLNETDDDKQTLLDSVSIQGERQLTLIEKKRAFIWLLQFVIPLMLVYFAEYFINQGLLELVFFKGAFLKDIHSQYRWYCVIYQLGVFISRSSVNVIHIKFLPIFPILQFVNLALIVLQIFYNYIPNIWIMFALVLFEGLLGGGAYCNTFYRITEEADDRHREFCMGVGCMGDSLGISVAAAVAIPVHNLFCRL